MSKIESAEINTLIAARISQINHQAFQEYQRWLGETVSPNWEEMSAEWRRHNIAAVEAVMMKGFHQDEIGTQHQKWVDSLTEQGYVHGAVKDHDAKTHPSLIPFDQLTLTEKIKDFLFLTLSKTQFRAYSEGIEAGLSAKRDDGDDEGSTQESVADLDRQEAREL